jgi:hypothetical protein
LWRYAALWITEIALGLWRGSHEALDSLKMPGARDEQLFKDHAGAGLL